MSTPAMPAAEDPAPAARRGVRLGVQVAGFLIGLGLLGWCVAMAW